MSNQQTPAKRPDESYDEYAARLLEQHGPPPQNVVDLVHQLQHQAAAKKNTA